MNFDLEENFKVDFKSISFVFRDRKFNGDGSLKWDIKEGFSIDSHVSPKDNKKIGEIKLGGDGVISGTWLKLKMDNNWSAICPHVFINSGHIMSIMVNNKLSIDFPDIILFTQRSHLDKKYNHYGKCVYSIKKSTCLPDTVKQTTAINGKVISKSSSLKGFVYKDTKVKILGQITKNNYLEVSWQFLSDKYTLNYEWRFPKALRTALSICLGQSIELLSSEIYNHYRTIKTYSKYREATSLGHFSPINIDKFNKKLFGLLLYNQLEYQAHFEIVNHLFYRLVDSLKVKNFHLCEFMISTALEATLRTIDNKPFPGNKSKDTWRFNSSLSELKKTYFSKNYVKEYRKIFKTVLNNVSFLRHKNAHPDWINLENSEINQDSYDKMLFLVRFYGYLILAFVGYDDLEPKNISV